MNCGTENENAHDEESYPWGRGSTHDKVDPEMEPLRCVEGRASEEPFWAKRHPST